MRRAIPKPCWGPRASRVVRIIRPRVPGWTSSCLGIGVVIWVTHMTRRLPKRLQFRKRSSVSGNPIGDRNIEFAAEGRRTSGSDDGSGQTSAGGEFHKTIWGDGVRDPSRRGAPIIFDDHDPSPDSHPPHERRENRFGVGDKVQRVREQHAVPPAIRLIGERKGTREVRQDRHDLDWSLRDESLEGGHAVAVDRIDPASGTEQLRECPREVALSGAEVGPYPRSARDGVAEEGDGISGQHYLDSTPGTRGLRGPLEPRRRRTLRHLRNNPPSGHAMRPRLVRSFVLLLVVAFPFSVSAQSGGTPIERGRRYTLNSRALGEPRAIDVALPSGYDTDTSQRYPVLVVLDGEFEGEIATAVSRFYADAGQLPNTIVVGVRNTNRNRDMTPAPAAGFAIPPEAEGAGGAERFLAFLSDELLPYLDQHYRTAPLRVLVGHSLGGLFAIYALDRRPGLFSGYVVMEPAAWWNNGKEFKDARAVLATPAARRERLML